VSRIVECAAVWARAASRIEDESAREADGWREVAGASVAEYDRLRGERDGYREALERISEVLAANGCDCECDHDVESHDDDCERCVACRVSLALAGQDAGKEKE
jgi:hypothetical protein